MRDTTTAKRGRWAPRRWWSGRSRATAAGTAHGTAVVDPVVIAPNDPLMAYVVAQDGPVDLGTLQLDSPGVRALRAAGVRMLVPLVSQGQLVGMLQLGERLSEQDYSTDDRRLLEAIAGQAAPALRLAEVVEEQAAAARVRERVEQELRVAQLIQQRFLPTELPTPDGWDVAAFYRAAREVGGDFYDFIDLPDGRLGVVIGDVTDKGVPAALVMASTRSILRAAAQRLVEPGAVLARVNDELVRDMPPKMFVTCFYAVMDAAAGVLRYANAGHDLPYLEHRGETTELRATGMPLGLLPAMVYEEAQIAVPEGGRVLLYSDGIAEAHAPDRQMYGFPRLRKELAAISSEDDVIDEILTSLAAFTGADWEQEDDITMVSLHRRRQVSATVLERFTADSVPGGERVIIDHVRDAIAGVRLTDARRDALGTAVGEAAMNAMEHGSGYGAPIEVLVTADDAAVRVRVTDPGPGRGDGEPEAPDLQAKLAGDQSPRGWGLFLIRELVDDLTETTDADGHHVTLTMACDPMEDDDA